MASRCGIPATPPRIRAGSRRRRVRPSGRAILAWLFLAIIALSPAARARQEADEVAPGESAGDPFAEQENPFGEPAAEEILFRGEVVVTQVTKRAQGVREAPASVYVIDGEDLRRFGYRTVFEALQQVPGVFVADDSEFRAIGMRGPAIVGDFNSRILLLLDGHPLNEPARGTATGSDLAVPIDLVERIEVMKGPGSVVHGTSAFFGVVNIVTKGASELRGGLVSGSIGSFDAYEGLFAYGTYLAPDLEVALSGSYRSWNGPAEKVRAFDAVSDAADERFRDAYLRLRWGDIRLAARTSRHTRQQQGAPFGSNFDSPDNLYRDKKNWVEVSYEPKIGETGTIRARAFLDRYRFDDFLDFRPFFFFRDMNEARTWGIEWIASARLSDRHIVTSGVEYQRTTASFRSWVPELVQTAAGSDTFAIWKIFLEDEYRITDTLLLNAGIQYNHHGLFDSGFSPRVALIHTPNDRDTWKLIYSEGFRNPTFIEAFFDDGSALLENPDLSSERVRSIEAVYERRDGDKSDIVVSAWWSKADDLIQQTPVIHEGRPRLQFLNTRGFEVYGAEVSGRWRFSSGARAFAGLTLQDEDGPKLVNYPHWIFNAGYSHPLLPDRVFLSGTVHAVAQREGGAFSADSDSYALVDLVLLVRRFPVRNAETTLGVYNLFDDEVFTPTPLSFLPDLMRSQRRALGLKVVWRF